MGASLDSTSSEHHIALPAYVLLQQNKKTLVMKQRLNFFLFIYLFICPICQLEGRSMIEPAKEPGDYITSNSKFIFFQIVDPSFQIYQWKHWQNESRYLKNIFLYFCAHMLVHMYHKCDFDCFGRENPTIK